MTVLQFARYLRATNYGRTDGWWVELDDAPVGELYDPRFVDMFWHSYAVRSLAGGESNLADDRLWQACRFTFRSRGTGTVAPAAFAGGSPPYVQDGRVLMRGLHLLPRSWLERLLLQWGPKSPDGFCCPGAKGRFHQREIVGGFLVAGLDPWDRTVGFFSGSTMAHRHDYAEVLQSVRKASAALSDIGISNFKLLLYGRVNFCASCGANLQRHYGIHGGALRDDRFVAELADDPKARGLC